MPGNELDKAIERAARALANTTSAGEFAWGELEDLHDHYRRTARAKYNAQRRMKYERDAQRMVKRWGKYTAEART